MSSQSPLYAILPLFENLPTKAIYLIGLLESKTTIPAEIFPALEAKLIQGRIGEVHEIMARFENKATESDASEMINKLKGTEIYKEKFVFFNEETCFICGENKNSEEKLALSECRHIFHKICLINEMEFLLSNNVSVLKCPCCSFVIEINDLFRFLPPLLLNAYDNIKSLSVSQMKLKVQCSNLKCKEIFEVESQQKNCKSCGYEINLELN